MRRVSSMAAVSSMHEQMNHRARQQEHVGQCPEQVRAMLLPEEEGRDREKEAQPQPYGNSPGFTARGRLTDGWHGILVVARSRERMLYAEPALEHQGRPFALYPRSTVTRVGIPGARSGNEMPVAGPMPEKDRASLGSVWRRP